MGTIFRSEKMQLVQMIVQNDAAHAVVEAFGEEGIIEFRDLNHGQPFHKRAFTDEVKRCEDVQRKLAALKHALEADGVAIAEAAKESMSAAELAGVLAEKEEELNHMQMQELMLKKNHNALLEQRHVLELGAGIYAAQAPGSSMSAGGAELEITDFASSTATSMLSYIAGVMPRLSMASFQRVIFRATRGNAAVYSKAIDETLHSYDLKSGETEAVEKDFFMIFVAGDVLKSKISKIATYFDGTLYAYPDMAADKAAMKREVLKRLGESSEILRTTAQMKTAMLTDVGAHFASWNFTICKDKMIYDTFNKFDYDVRRKVFVADAWVPESKVYDVYKTLSAATAKAGVETRPVLNLIETKATPPTHLPVDKMVYGFQALVNTYGTPRYREVNAGAFAVILFPFLFGIMFGDLGHGTLLMLFGLSMIRNEASFEGKKLDDLVEMCYGGRYVIFLNGCFGMYVGLIYNEAFACPMSIWGSGYDRDKETIIHPPIFGVEPAWHHATNKISFFNSFKMKISIIVGVLQMTFGIFLSLLNHLEYRNYKKVVFQFLPELGFFGSIFGYLIFLIFYKWSVPWVELGKPAPSLLTTLINMFMSPGAVALPENAELLLFQGQADVEAVLILVALVCVPLLLFPIPFLESCEHEAALKKKLAYKALEGGSAHEEAAVHEEGEHEFSFGDAFVHQAIHTIEFVLGSISNTASYLRLWALSLAHSQLSELFWEKLLVEGALEPKGSSAANMIGCWVAVIMWIVISFMVLMVMENLSSFLHALRLQWVEFQGKFYSGDGIRFVAFDFKTIGEESSE
ncbi:hypothetical protein KFE25_012451 [Diacronema lutheri]|uniref:V-type proton ATPase subunit a n=1 Tax=Diacronema lutheri TaxID=2081491 RepID=A0A8J5XIH9_DIALT|nr:hypothetical protein KFE25_012451 [Diacronema lutheri]